LSKSHTGKKKGGGGKEEYLLFHLSNLPL
jgi:hypothetical protein